MTAPISNKPYVLKKGDTLDAIAKKHGHKDGKAIWSAPENKGIVSKRKKPADLLPGDSLFIPPNAAQLKTLAKKIATLNADRNSYANMLAALNNDSDRLTRKIKYFDDVIKDSQKTTDEIVAQLEKGRHGMKNWATGVDAAKMLASLGVGLGKLIYYGRKASKAAGEALLEENKEALKELKFYGKEQGLELGSKVLGTLKDSLQTGAAAVGIVGESYDKITSPSFWANTWVQMTENGKTWGEAVSSDIGDDFEEKIKHVNAVGAESVKRLRDTQKTFSAKLSENRKLANECNLRINANEKEAASLQ